MDWLRPLSFPTQKPFPISSPSLQPTSRLQEPRAAQPPSYFHLSHDSQVPWTKSLPIHASYSSASLQTSLREHFF